MSQNPYEPPKTPCSPEQPPSPPGVRSIWASLAPEYSRAMSTAWKIQAALALLTALVLDGGQLFRLFLIALFCQWAVVWFITFRRPLNPTRLGLAMIRYGIILVLAIVSTIGYWLS